MNRRLENLTVTLIILLALLFVIVFFLMYIGLVGYIAFYIYYFIFYLRSNRKEHTWVVRWDMIVLLAICLFGLAYLTYVGRDIYNFFNIGSVQPLPSNQNQAPQRRIPNNNNVIPVEEGFPFVNPNGTVGVGVVNRKNYPNQPEHYYQLGNGTGAPGSGQDPRLYPVRGNGQGTASYTTAKLMKELKSLQKLTSKKTN